MPIALNKQEWARIGQWTHRGAEDPETVRRREYVQYLDATSKAMTKSWPNSLENVNKRNEELRLARQQAAEAANTNFYKRYVKRQQQEQERLMASARETVFKNRDAPKLLLSAVIETVVQKEREEQLKFGQEQRRARAEQKRREDDDIIRRAREWRSMLDLKKQTRFEINKQHQKEILEQAQVIAERNRIEYEAELNLQKIDNIKADQEMEAIKKFEEDFKAAEKRRIWSDMEQARLEAAARRDELAARDRLDDRLLQVLARAQNAVDNRRKQTELGIKQDKLRVLEKISQSLESGDAEREAKDQAIMDKAVKEKEAIALERRRREDASRAAARAGRQRAAREARARDERRLRDARTHARFDLMNRIKNAEIYEEFQDNLRKEKTRKTLEYKEEILKLWRERDEREARALAETRKFYGEEAERRLRAEDARLLRHARALRAEARQHGRPERPLLRAVDRYCKMYRLYPMPELPRGMQEHFGDYQPLDWSQPDDAPDGPDAELDSQDHKPDTQGIENSPQGVEQTPPEAVSKRNGLEHGSKMPPNSQKMSQNLKVQPQNTDYKRSNKANGLQQKIIQDKTQLPPVTAAPCKEDCVNPCREQRK